MTKKTTGPRSWEDLVLDGLAARQQADDANWRLGDLAAEVVVGYGQRKLQDFADTIHVEYNTLRNYRWVARRFDQSARRRANLAFGHFDAVASRDDADRWLAKAKRSRWSISRLRQELREAETAKRARQAARRAARSKFDSHFHKGDARDWIDDSKLGLKDGSVRLLLTDPPYGMAHKSGIAGDLTREEAVALLHDVLERMEPKLRDDAVCAVFCEWDDVFIQQEVAQFFDIHGRVRWDKGHGVGGEFFIFDAEDVIIGSRKGRPLPSTFFFPLHGTLLYARPPEFLRIHPMEKPFLMLAELILATTVEKDVVADPFAGSGASLFAAISLGRRYWGTELNRAKGKQMDWYPRGLERLSGASQHAKARIEETLRELYRLGRYDFRSVPHHLLATRIFDHANYHDHDCRSEGCDTAERLAAESPVDQALDELVGRLPLELLHRDRAEQLAKWLGHAPRWLGHPPRKAS